MSFGAVYYLVWDQVICTLTKLSEIKHYLDNAKYGALYGIYSLSFIITLISFCYKCVYK